MLAGADIDHKIVFDCWWHAMVCVTVFDLSGSWNYVDSFDGEDACLRVFCGDNTC